MSKLFSIVANDKAVDHFARIAAQRDARCGRLLVELKPPKLPRRFVPAAKSDAQAVFRPQPKMDTAEKLRAELVRQREAYMTFLRNLAPKVPSVRQVELVREMNWRLEPNTDWQLVKLPHYGGPIGRATAHYRTAFQMTEAMKKAGALFVCFEGVDYKAHVFINDTYVGSHEGFFAPFEFEFTKLARTGENTLSVRVENDAIHQTNNPWQQETEGDKIYAATGLGWDDPELGWHHCPPGMGIWGEVKIESRPVLHLRDVFVRPLLEENRAEAWIEVLNSSENPQPVTFTLSLFGQNFSAKLFENRAFDSGAPAGPGVNYYRFSITIPKPRVWDTKTPWLYQLQVCLPNGDACVQQFGMRSFRMDTEHQPRGRMFLNGKEVRLRGANTMGFEQQDVLRGDFDQLRDDLLLAKICNLNFLRLTQRPVQRAVYEMCDRLGLMTQTDLPLFAHLRRNQFCEAVRQAEEMERMVRSHACNIMVSYINEPFPYSWRKNTHRHLTRAELESFFVAADQAVRLANPDRVIKPIDGDYDAPGPGLPDNHCYPGWYNGHGIELGKLHKGFWQPVKPGWQYACGEFGAEGLDSENVMRRFYPPNWLPNSAEEEKSWTPNRITQAQTGRMYYCHFDKQTSVAGWINASQAHQSWVTRLMTEAFRRDNRMVSFAIHLFIDAWPAGWMKTIMDCLRQPKSAFFAYREALTPLMANIRSDRHTYFAGELMKFEFWICNDTHDQPKNARLRYQLEVDGEVVFAQQTRALVKPCQSQFQGILKLRAPEIGTRSTATLRLALVRRDGAVIHDTALPVELFPAPESQPILDAVVMGDSAIAKKLGARPVKSAGLYLITDAGIYAKCRREVDAAVKIGAKVLFLELPAGEHFIGDRNVKIEPCGMSPRHFVSRATGHPLVENFRMEDFRFWHDPALGRPSPLLHTLFTTTDWTPILTTGNGGWGGEWSPALASAELRHGAGCYRICQVQLAGRVRTNPVARLFARDLLTCWPSAEEDKLIVLRNGKVEKL